jgi:REP element-mobilizing transposase RayT
MGRLPRYPAPDTVYHVICRGNNRQDIFLDNRDYFKYLDLWLKYKAEMNFEVYAYVLMTNHVHWLLKTGLTPLSEIIHRVHSVYARWFNYKHERVGHLFQGRYQAYTCTDDAYLLALARYIHLNPVKAGLVEKVYLYPWSSYHSYLGQESNLVDTEFLLNYFNQNIDQARRGFVKFTQQAISPEDDALLKTPPQKEKRQLMPLKTKPERTYDKASPNKGTTTVRNNPSLDQIAAWIENATGVSLPELRDTTQKRQVVLARNLFIKIAVQEAGVKRSLVAKYLGKDRSLITKVLEKWSEDNISPPAIKLLLRFKKEFGLAG